MEYLNLVAGLILLIVFTLIFVRNIKRKGFIHTLFRFDTVVGIIAGVYLVATSTIALFH